MKEYIQDLDFQQEFEFTTSRSGGPGGQHVNTTNSKVLLKFNIDNSYFLAEPEKKLLKEYLSNKLTAAGELHIVSEKHRSQLKNKEEAIKKFYRLLKAAFKPKKKRIETKPPKAAIEKRIKTKKNESLKKEQRRKIQIP